MKELEQFKNFSGSSNNLLKSLNLRGINVVITSTLNTLLEMFFVEFVELFFPEIIKDMDKNHVKFLREEVITDYKEFTKHYVDILVETKLRGKME
ncbi:MAG: hypothetical protein KAX49_16320 [Halanaerobiales bacterium]|nr:hypothetical protein [Halanaerobiales bacterium]